ncbi:MAG: hypothetical protein DCC67_19930 [Planctomycetota bacterium]|nr:MAG: hypothetical protein DCC67_19930 [Planctomycetota bacterium]
MRRFRFRLRTLLGSLAVASLALGGLRWRYDQFAAAERRDRAVVESTAYAKTVCRWKPAARAWPAQFSRVEHLWCDDAPQLLQLAPQLTDLSELQSIQVLARQIAGHAATAAQGAADPVIGALRRHGSLRTIIVDATIRGAPLEYDAPLYTRKDKALLEKLLPNVRIEWIEAN